MRKEFLVLMSFVLVMFAFSGMVMAGSGENSTTASSQATVRVPGWVSISVNDLNFNKDLGGGVMGLSPGDSNTKVLNVTINPVTNVHVKVETKAVTDFTPSGKGLTLVNANLAWSAPDSGPPRFYTVTGVDYLACIDRTATQTCPISHTLSVPATTEAASFQAQLQITATQIP